ncbi:MAG: hypothetical protein IGS38_22905 [Synechococcales cyanobacterium M58_A2018_015]|nr:hypothetical protein [Synechococcales cyanobacterium M58_A2018_015]
MVFQKATSITNAIAVTEAIKPSRNLQPQNRCHRGRHYRCSIGIFSLGGLAGSVVSLSSLSSTVLVWPALAAPAPSPAPITQSPPATPTAPIQSPPPARPAAPAPFPSPTVPTAPTAPATPATPAPATPPAATPAAPTSERASIPLVEQTSYINACRKTNRSTEVFADVALSPVNRVGTLNPDTTVALTGVLAQGRAQVLLRAAPNAIVLVGWVEAANLTTCDVALSPTPAPTQPAQPTLPAQPAATRVCYRVESDGALAVRMAASVTAEARGALPRGTIVYATTNPPREQTAPPTPPELGRQWVEITYQGGPAWIASTGPNGLGTNITRLSDGECAS